MDQNIINTLNQYNEGKYLVVKGKGNKKHLEIREYQSFKIPFIGRILQRIIYPSSRFKNVITYLLEQQGHLDDVNTANRVLLKSKIEEYFKLNQEVPQNHQKLWNKVNVKFNEVFNPPPIKTSAFHLQGGEVREDDIYFKLPDTILEKLPRGHDYVVVDTFHLCNRPMNGWNDEKTMERFHDDLKTKNKPIVILIFYPNVNKMGLRDIEVDEGKVKQRLEALKEKGILVDYMGVDRGDTIHKSAEKTWQEHEEENLRSVEDLKKRLGET